MRPAENTHAVQVFDDPEQVARAAARRFVELAEEAVRARGVFSVALAGGTTPRRVYELLAGDEFRARVDWAGVHFFFGDERCVPPDDPASNYLMAHETLLSRVPVPAENVHRIEGRGDAAANASLYESELRGFFGETDWPRFDLVLLGMGDDGHTASLFPETKVLQESAAWVAAVWVEKLQAWRVTLTAPAINHARHVAFLVTGSNKSATLARVIKGERTPEVLPAQLIIPSDGTLEWLVDKAAAAGL